MKTRIHSLAGQMAILTISIFWLSTLFSELFLSFDSVRWVKQSIVIGLIVLIPLLAATGASGFMIAKGSSHPLILRKKRRMPIIAVTGLLILVPAAIYLSWKAQSGEFDAAFYTVQVIEILAGVLNLFLMTSNARDGMKLRKPS